MKNQILRALAGVLLPVMILCGCSGESIPDTIRPANSNLLLPADPGTDVVGNDFASMDISHAGSGYIQVRYQGQASKAKVQITIPDGTVYTYTLKPGGFEILPLTGGSGEYSITVLENAFDNIYAVAFTTQVKAGDMNEFTPYLYPNQYVWYTGSSRIHALGAEISARSRDDLHYVENVYTYVVESVTYDHELAENIPVDYLPNLDKILDTGKGICLDFAALMTALLRSQGIPTKLVVGYAGQQYHAWISVYIEQTGWMDGVIFFDGVNWSRIDPTLAAGNRHTSVKEYVNNSGNYREKYFY